MFGEVGEGGTIRNLGVVASYVKGNRWVGGMVGANDGFNAGTITNCYVTGNVSGNEYVGGMVGWNSGGITNCYAAGNVSGESNVGGIAGTGSWKIYNSYYDKETSGQSNGDKGEPKTTEEMKRQATYVTGTIFAIKQKSISPEIWRINYENEKIHRRYNKRSIY